MASVLHHIQAQEAQKSSPTARKDTNNQTGASDFWKSLPTIAENLRTGELKLILADSSESCLYTQEVNEDLHP